MNINYTSILAPHRLMNGLKAFWKMNDSSGNAIDQLGNINLIPSGTIGYLGDSLEFADGTNGRVTSSSVSFINPFYDKFTIAYWIYFTKLYSTSGQNQYVISIDRTSGPSYWLSMYINATDYLAFYFKTTDGAACESHSQGFGTMLTGVWYHFVGVANGIGNYSTFYRNNVAISGFSAQTAPIAQSNNTISIGSISTGLESCARIANVGIWDRNLSASEVAQLYGYGRTTVYPFI
jgi:hypothetical protein